MNFEFMTIDTPLPPCMPFPRALTGFPVSSTAKVMYCRMLDAMLSKGQEDENGILFVCFPVTAIAAVLSRSSMTVKRSLNELETAGLMLCVTNDGRKIGLDVRLMNPMLPDDPNSKLNVCVQNVLKIWEEGKDQKLTQLLFCDLSTPKNDGNFNVYDDIRKKLVAAGVPENEIEFIHNADTEAKKAALFSKVRSGDVRVLLGSTAKMGAGTNVQSRLVAVHHLDVGWKPSDMTQRNGRIIRQGNMNKEVKVFNYVTEGTFDSYLFVRHEVA